MYAKPLDRRVLRSMMMRTSTTCNDNLGCCLSATDIFSRI
jgi:hypothetical protein